MLNSHPMDSPDTSTAPSLPRRLTAILYDALLVLAMVAVVNATALGVLVKLTSGEQQVLAPHLVQLLTLFSIIGFFMVFWLKSGQTLGMQAWRIQLQTTKGARPRVHQCLLRCCIAVPALFFGGLGYWWSAFDPLGRRWHDWSSGTRIVVLPKQQNTKH